MKPILSLLVVPLILLSASAFSQSRSGETRWVTVPCISGWMTFPPRTEYCVLPLSAGWFVRSANFSSAELGGTGGNITIVPDALVSEDRLRSMSKQLSNEIQASLEVNTKARTAQLASLLQQLASGAVPLQKAASVSVRVTLRSWQSGFGCAPGMTTSSCPHVTVPQIDVEMICLPESD